MAARILIVEDDTLVRELTATLLSEAGYEVATAGDGWAGLAALEASRPDLVLLDLRMPEMDGWAFAQRYRELAEPRAPLVLFSTANDLAEHAVALGAAAWIEKPFAIDALTGIVRSQLATAA